jgi:serine/threonine-protein kinase
MGTLGGTYFLGRYRVVDEIGIGGMASVHLARMDGPGGFQKWIAIKRIHPHLVEDDTFVNMFLDEARVAARISHPNVATVFELGRHDSTYWIAMEYLHGEPLREIMRRTLDLGTPMPPDIACRIIADAAEGLHAAHELLGNDGEKLGLVHRDVTPHNLFVTYDGNTKVVDFGIAKFSSRMASTRAGTLKGKLAYMSPEQVTGQSVDRRTDVFALGVVLWELTTGQRLFRMQNDLDTLAKVQECAIPLPSTVVRGYPSDVEAATMKALAKNPAERYRTARELSRALQSLLMRRGLFVASDEVAAYMASVFGDRIEKREAHLRWAAEVTNTIDLDKVPDLPPSPWPSDDRSILTFNSDVLQSQSSARSPPRPAAVAPPPESVSRAASVSRKAAAAPAGVLDTGDAAVPVRAAADLGVAAVPVRAAADVGVAAVPVRAAADLGVAAVPDFSEPAGPDDAPTLARPRSASYDDEFEDGCDTIVNEAMPDIVDIEPPPPLGTTATQAASPTAIACHVAAIPTPRMTTDLTGTAVVNAGFGQSQPTLPLAPSPAPGPPIIGSVTPSFFPPPAMLNELATVNAPVRRRHVPVWAVAVSSAAAGLTAFALVVFGLSVVRHRAPGGTADAKASASAKAAGVSPNASRPPPPPDVPAQAPSSEAPEPGAAAQPPAAPSAGTSSTATASAARTQPVAAARPASASAASSAAALAATGTLNVFCVPVCDQVFDNGVAAGPSPAVRRGASVGSHRVKLVWGDASKVVSVVVIADQTTTVHESHP